MVVFQIKQSDHCQIDKHPFGVTLLGLGQIFVNNFLNNRQLLEEVE